MIDHGHHPCLNFNVTKFRWVTLGAPNLMRLRMVRSMLGTCSGMASSAPGTTDGLDSQKLYMVNTNAFERMSETFPDW